LSGPVRNLFGDVEPRDFWVWVNPSNWLVRHQISIVGGFLSGGLVPNGRKWNLMFIPNPDFSGEIIGYSIVPWKRRRGCHASASRSLAEGRAEGLEFVEITADLDNIPSHRIIEANGGVLVERFKKPAQ